jgi:hypothetical protein
VGGEQEREVIFADWLAEVEALLDRHLDRDAAYKAWTDGYSAAEYAYEKTNERVRTLSRRMPLSLRGNVTTFLPRDGLDLSKRYFDIASDFWRDAKILHDHDGLVGKYLLASHALELVLKSFLAKSGLSEKELSKPPFHHDLVALYEEAVRRGLTDVHHVRAVIDHANQYHYKSANEEDDWGTLRYALRYDAGPKVLTSCGTLLEVISAILNEIDPVKCR